MLRIQFYSMHFIFENLGRLVNISEEIFCFNGIVYAFVLSWIANQVAMSLVSTVF